MHDSMGSGRSLRLFTVRNDYTRECLWIDADTSLSGPRVALVLDFVAAIRGKPTSRSANSGSEFAGLALERWAHEHEVKHRYIAPGKPPQNAYIESFNGKLHDECVNEHELTNLHHARELIDAYRDDYNPNRPHSPLDGLTPNQLAAKIARALMGMGAPVDKIGPALAPKSSASKQTLTDPALSL